FIVSVCVSIFYIIGCGSQNEYLSKGKEWVKSDKRGKIAKAVAQFELAIEKEPENAEAHYLLGYYDENATIERRAEQMVLAYKYNKRKYLKILIEEALRDRNENVRKSAIMALQEIHTNIDPMIKPLVKALKSKNSRARDDAALVLSKLSNYKEVVERLTQEDIIKHKRMGTRFCAVRALGDIGDPTAIKVLMDRITALKTEDQKGEEAEVRRAAVIALKQISKRNIEINSNNGQSAILDIQAVPTENGIKITQDISGELSKKLTIQKDEIIYSVIDNKKVKSLDEFNQLVNEAINSKIVTFGIPKIVKVRATKPDDIGIVWDNSKNDGLVVKNLTIDSKAGKLGIEKGEVISYINDQPVKTIQDYERIVNESIAKGEEIKFTVANDDKFKTVSVAVPEFYVPQLQEDMDKDKMTAKKSEKENKQKVEQKPTGDTMQIPILGITVQSLPYNAEGVVIIDLRPQSPAVEAGLRLGQVISFVVSEKKVENVEQFKQLVKDGLEDNNVKITVINKNAINKLIEILQNKGLIVRFDAAIALGELRNKAAVDSLIEMLQEETNPIEIKL
ncbi:MAG: HEAT repeat domain-containing protein, partial [Candidatus Poribacteria bacterium]